MKTRVAAGVAAAALLLTVSSTALAQSPRGMAEGTVGDASISIDYGRPSLQGRDMLAQVTDGMVWRLGADAATVLTTSHDLDFGGTTIEAGSYSLFAKKTGDSWALLVNSQTGQWGTEHDASRDIAEIPLMLHGGSPQEQFTISIAGSGGQGMIHFEWGESILMATFQTN